MDTCRVGLSAPARQPGVHRKLFKRLPLLFLSSTTYSCHHATNQPSIKAAHTAVRLLPCKLSTFAKIDADRYLVLTLSSKNLQLTSAARLRYVSSFVSSSSSATHTQSHQCSTAISRHRRYHPVGTHSSKNDESLVVVGLEDKPFWRGPSRARCPGIRIIKVIRQKTTSVFTAPGDIATQVYH
jgi:hypothetical protein